VTLLPSKNRRRRGLQGSSKTDRTFKPQRGKEALIPSAQGGVASNRGGSTDRARNRTGKEGGGLQEGRRTADFLKDRSTILREKGTSSL